MIAFQNDLMKVFQTYDNFRINRSFEISGNKKIGKMFGSEHKMYLCQTLWDYSKCQHLTDVSIGCSDGIIGAHKVILYSLFFNIFKCEKDTF